VTLSPPGPGRGPGGSSVQYGYDALPWWNGRHRRRLLDVGRRRLRLDCRLEPPGQALDLGGMLGSGRLERRLETSLLRRELRGQAFDLGGKRLERRLEVGPFRREVLAQTLDLGRTLGSGRLERRLETGLLRPEPLGQTLDLGGPLGSSSLECRPSRRARSDARALVSDARSRRHARQRVASRATTSQRAPLRRPSCALRRLELGSRPPRAPPGNGPAPARGASVRRSTSATLSAAAVSSALSRRPVPTPSPRSGAGPRRPARPRRSRLRESGSAPRRDPRSGAGPPAAWLGGGAVERPAWRRACSDARRSVRRRTSAACSTARASSVAWTRACSARSAAAASTAVGEPGPFALRRSQRCDQELDPIGIGPLGFAGSG